MNPERQSLASRKAVDALTALLPTLKFNESDWVRNAGRFADFTGSRRGAAGGGGSSGATSELGKELFDVPYDAVRRAEVVARIKEQQKYDPSTWERDGVFDRQAKDLPEGFTVRPFDQSGRNDPVIASNQTGSDGTIHINEGAWNASDAEGRRSLVHHELGHNAARVMLADGSGQRVMEHYPSEKGRIRYGEQHPFGDNPNWEEQLSDASGWLTLPTGSSGLFPAQPNPYDKFAGPRDITGSVSAQNRARIYTNVASVNETLGYSMSPAADLAVSRYRSIKDVDQWPDTTSGKAINALTLLLPALKFNESEWVRNSGRFADFLGERGGGGGGAGAAKEAFQKSVESGEWQKGAEAEAWAKMTDEEKKTMERWVEYGSESVMQNTLRGGDSITNAPKMRDFYRRGAEEQAAVMEGAIAKMPPLPQDLDVYRGVLLKSKTLKKIQPGDTYEDAGFSAVTPHRGAAENFINGTYGSSPKGKEPVVLRLKLKAGTRVYATNGRSNESLDDDGKGVHELLLSHGMKARVVSRKTERLAQGGQNTGAGMPEWYKPVNLPAGAPITVITLEVE